MKKHFKVLTGIFAGVIAAVVLVTAGAYANEFRKHNSVCSIYMRCSVANVKAIQRRGMK